MAALEDYLTLPMWLAVCAVLEDSPEPRSLVVIQKAVLDRSSGRLGLDRNAIRKVLGRLCHEGLLEDLQVPGAGGRELRGYRVTDNGRELAGEAKTVIARLLALAVKG